MSEQTEHGPTQQPPAPAAPPRHWALRVLGLRRRRGRVIRLVPTKWGWVLLLLVVCGVGGAGFAEYSMQPDFCRSCHIMEPYYTAWHESKHKDVPCADCHFEPGWRNTIKGKWQASSQAVKYVTNTYGSKPHAEIRDASCMRSGCHEKRLLEGKVDWPVPTGRGGTVTIRFDHAPHLQPDRRGKQLRCVSCHSQMVQGQHIVVTLDTCFLCHFKGLEHGRNDQTLAGCDSCHAAPKEKIRLATGMFAHEEYVDRGVTCENCHSEVVKGDGAVPRQVCWTCHNQPRDIARYDETKAMHTIHVSDVKVECSSCHVQIEHSLAAAIPGGGRKTGIGDMLHSAGSCSQCHDKTHAGPAEMYRGTGARGVPDMPSAMSRAQVDCIACHKSPKGPGDTAVLAGQTFRATQDACDACHGTKYSTTLAEWKQTVDRHLRQAEAAYANAGAKLDSAGLSAAEALPLRRKLDDAEHNIRFARLGHGVHNVTYAVGMLNRAVEDCQAIERALDPTASAPEASAPEASAPEAVKEGGS